MIVDEWTSEDVHTPGGGELPPCAGLTSNAFPEAQSTVSAESSQTGVSTKNAHIASKPKAQNEVEIPHWYALRTTYGREKKAYDYMTVKGITAFYPTTDTVKLIKGKRKVVTESRLPNIFFAWYRRTTQIFCLRQRQPPISPLLLSPRPRWAQNRENSIDSSRLSDGKSQNHLCCRCGQYNRVISRSAKVRERTVGKGYRWCIQRGGWKSCTLARTAKSWGYCR